MSKNDIQVNGNIGVSGSLTIGAAQIEHLKFLYSDRKHVMGIIILLGVPSLVGAIGTMIMVFLYWQPIIGARQAAIVGFVGTFLAIFLNAMSFPLKPGLNLLVRMQFALPGRYFFYFVTIAVNLHILLTSKMLWDANLTSELAGSPLISQPMMVGLVWCLAGVVWLFGALMAGLFVGWHIPPEWVHQRLMEFINVDRIVASYDAMKDFYATKLAWLTYRLRDGRPLDQDDYQQLLKFRRHAMGSMNALSDQFRANLTYGSPMSLPKGTDPETVSMQRERGNTKVFLRDMTGENR